jgi:hypothetical protein
MDQLSVRAIRKRWDNVGASRHPMLSAENAMRRLRVGMRCAGGDPERSRHVAVAVPQCAERGRHRPESWRGMRKHRVTVLSPVRWTRKPLVTTRLPFGRARSEVTRVGKLGATRRCVSRPSGLSPRLPALPVPPDFSRSHPECARLPASPSGRRARAGLPDAWSRVGSRCRRGEALWPGASLRTR